MNILIIEDDKQCCRQFEHCINEIDGLHLCATTTDANEAVQLTAHYLPDVVILDLELHLGGGNGLEYLHALRHACLHQRPLIIVTTNNTSQIILDTARELGADMILTKYEKNYSAEYVIKTICLMQDTINKSPAPDIVVPAESPAERERRMRIYLQKQLDLIGINPKHLGYKYLLDAILLVWENPQTIVSKCLSKKYKKSSSSIDRAMQNAIKNAWINSDPQDLQTYYTAMINPDRGAPTMMEFISYYVEQINLLYTP